MSAQIIQFKPIRQWDAPVQEASHIDWQPIKREAKYAATFAKNLAIWLATGAVLSIFLPTWVIFTGLIAVQYFWGRK